MKTEYRNDSAETNRCWMVVDDDETMLSLTGQILEMFCNAKICRFSSATTALKAFRESPGEYAGVVTDLNMPEMDGIQFCEELRQLAPKMPVILASGSAEITQSEAQSRGFFRFLPKPFPIQAMQETFEAAKARIAALN